MTEADSTGRFYLNSYRPLVATPAGRQASHTRGIPPFVDGSIRREPDLEHPLPAISCLCRADKFAPRLRVGDTVAYVTVKDRYVAGQPPQRRLTAVLRVVRLFPAHAEAAEWYAAQGLALPNNCLVRGNRPKPLAESHRHHRHGGCLAGDALLRRWDAGYRARCARFGTFVVCEAMFRDLSWDAPVVEDRHLLEAFGRLPGTRNPGALPAGGLTRLMALLGIAAPLSAQ
jgi:hypothetical protein